MQPEIEEYKNYPEGSGGRKIYEMYTMPFPDWVAKYYANPDLTGYSLFLMWAEEAQLKAGKFLKEWCSEGIRPFDFNKRNALFVP